METTERHILQWDIRIRRDFPAAASVLGRRIDLEPSPPVGVEVSATFDDDESARAFERAVRELLEKA